MGDRRGACMVWWGDLTEREHFEAQRANGRIILKWISNKWDGDWSGSGQGHVAGATGSIKCTEFLDWGPVSFSGRTQFNWVRASERIMQRNTNGLSLWITALRIRTTVTKGCHTYQFSQSNSKEASISFIFRKKYPICSRNLRTFFSILAAEKSGCVKYADFFCGSLDLGFILV